MLPSERVEVAFRLPIEMRDQLRLLGALRGETVGVVIRGLVREEIERANASGLLNKSQAPARGSPRPTG